MCKQQPVGIYIIALYAKKFVLHTTSEESEQ